MSAYERFTDRSRKVMMLANEEAKRFNHEYIGTEHILFGLVLERVGVAANVLERFGVSLPQIRDEVEKFRGHGPPPTSRPSLVRRLVGIFMGLPQSPPNPPHTSYAKKVIEYSIEEARSLKHNYVGTEHLLLGLLREKEGVAAVVLSRLGVEHETARRAVLDLLNPL